MSKDDPFEKKGGLTQLEKGEGKNPVEEWDKFPNKNRRNKI